MNMSADCGTTDAEIWITVLTFATLVLTAILGVYKGYKIRKKGRPSVEADMNDVSLPRMATRVYKIHHNVETILKEMGLSKTSDPS